MSPLVLVIGTGFEAKIQRWMEDLARTLSTNPVRFIFAETVRGALDILGISPLPNGVISSLGEVATLGVTRKCGPHGIPVLFWPIQIQNETEVFQKKFLAGLSAEHFEKELLVK